MSWFSPKLQLYWAFPATPTQGLSTTCLLPIKLLYFGLPTLWAHPFPHTAAFPGHWYCWGVCNGGWKWESVLGTEHSLQRKVVSHLPFTQVTFEINTHRDTHTYLERKKKNSSLQMSLKNYVNLGIHIVCGFNWCIRNKVIYQNVCSNNFKPCIPSVLLFSSLFPSLTHCALSATPLQQHWQR